MLTLLKSRGVLKLRPINQARSIAAAPSVFIDSGSRWNRDSNSNSSRIRYSYNSFPYFSFHTTALHPSAKSPFDTASSPEQQQRGSGRKQKKATKFVPRKAAVKLTEKSRKFFRQLLANPPRPDIIGIQLLYQQSSTGEPRMVFSFRFVTAKDLGPMDEGVSLELLEDGVTPKSPADAEHDGLPKLYVAGDAFLKVLGATVDVDTDTITPILYDREGNKMDPNA